MCQHRAFMGHRWKLRWATGGQAVCETILWIKGYMSALQEPLFGKESVVFGSGAPLTGD